ncbi:MAG: pentapeptide repeat-containing protein [Anaerolineae bacterium]|nr:pentapeptide repeat-containing protein [Anaerolineae bacterium]
MSNEEHLNVLKQGVQIWNEWRESHPDEIPDLRGAQLREVELPAVNLRGALLCGVNLQSAVLPDADLVGSDFGGVVVDLTPIDSGCVGQANLSGANLERARLMTSNLRGVDLSLSNLENANLFCANLNGANLREARLIGANLSLATMVFADLTGANISRCRIWGVSAWNVKSEGAIQNGLVVSMKSEPIVTADDLEVAQLIYMLVDKQKIRNVIDSVGRKLVLLLGRFIPDRKAVLDAVSDELRKQDYIPVIFDFQRPQTRNLEETVVTIAHLSRFVVADITDPASVPQELRAICEQLHSVPIQPIISSEKEPYALFESIATASTMMPLFRYRNLEEIVDGFREKLIKAAEEKAAHLQEPK